MRSLSATLTTAQQAVTVNALAKIVLTHGANTYTYERDRILDIDHTENGNLQSTKIILDNGDGELTDLDFKGYDAVLSMGAVSAGEEYSDYAPLTVIAQQFDSQPNKLVCTLTLQGICNLMAEDKASASYIPLSTDTKSVKTLVNEIGGATHASFTHCTACEVVWDDGYDTLADTYQPKDSFRIYKNGGRLAAINRLLNYTKNVMLAKNDGKLHIFSPTTTGTTYDYEYSLESGHPFFAKALRNRLVIPNYVKVESQDDDDPQYSGYATDAESYALLPKHEFHSMRLASNDQATDIAEAILAKAQMWSEAGSASVPLNVGAEVYDYVKVTDEREDDYRVGNIGKINIHYTATKNEWRMFFAFGNWLNVRKVYESLGITSDDVEDSFSRLNVKDLYVENILAENCDFEWLDPDNTIDLTKAGVDLDNLPDGETYARVKSLHLDAGGIKIDENIIYNPGYNPSQKKRNFTSTPTTPYDAGDLWVDGSVTKLCTNARATGDYVAGDWLAVPLDAIADGATFHRVKSAALSADGLVLLDQVVVGTYGLVKSTELSAGYLKLTTNTVWSGKVTVRSGITIDSASGINIWGVNNALTTRATETGTIQCYVGSDGKFYAGGGAAWIDNAGVSIKASGLRFYDEYSALKGYIFGSSSLDLVIQGGSPGKIYLQADGYTHIKLGNSQVLLYMPLQDQTTHVHYLYDIYPYTSGTWLGTSGNKFAAVYTDSLPTCPDGMPTLENAKSIFKNIKKLTLKDGFAGYRYYILDNDMPDEFKVDNGRKTFREVDDGVDDNGNPKKKVETDIEYGHPETDYIRVIGGLVKLNQELLEDIENLQAKVTALENI